MEKLDKRIKRKRRFEQISDEVISIFRYNLTNRL